MADNKVKESAAKKSSKAQKPAKKKSDKPNVFKRVWTYLRECKGEIKKITWTNPRTATRNFFVVLVVIIIAGLFIYGLDRGLYALLGLFMNTSAT